MLPKQKINKKIYYKLLKKYGSKLKLKIDRTFFLIKSINK